MIKTHFLGVSPKDLRKMQKVFLGGSQFGANRQGFGIGASEL